MAGQLVLRWVLKPTVDILESKLEKMAMAIRLTVEMAHMAV